MLQLPEVSPATVAGREVAAAKLGALAWPLKAGQPLQEALLALAGSPAADVTARAEAGRVVFSEKSALLEAALDRQVPHLWKVRIVDVVTRESVERSAAFQQMLFREAPFRVQARVVAATIADENSARYLVESMEAGVVPISLLTDAALSQRLKGSANPETRQRIDVLAARLPDTGAEVQRLIDQRRQSFDAAKADRAAGEQLYQLLCAVCHKLGGQGALVGPQLDGIGNRGLERLLEDILDPNRNVDHAFATTTLVLKNGDQESGLFRREEGAVLVLANSGGQEFSVPKADIAERHENSTSLMPANFGEALTEEQLRDLVAYLLGQTK
ncbi:MAG TPA: hypothetical protein DCY13_22240 [Verrucomicrobiales bacterium]|nr:hypothetical protein [Verrucomicrobiales bacterium]